MLERQKRHDDAEAVFREALAVEPDSAPILNYLGYMNADRGVRVEEALAAHRAAVALDPENGAYLDSLGWALFRLDRVDEAEQYLRRAVDKRAPTRSCSTTSATSCASAAGARRRSSTGARR